jgi:hypothetical protein
VSSSHLLSCIPSVSVLLLVSDSPYLLSCLCFRSGLALHSIIGGETGTHGRHVPLILPPWSSCVRGDAPVAVVIRSLFVLSRRLH